MSVVNQGYFSARAWKIKKLYVFIQHKQKIAKDGLVIKAQNTFSIMGLISKGFLKELSHLSFIKSPVFFFFFLSTCVLHGYICLLIPYHEPAMIKTVSDFGRQPLPVWKLVICV